MYIVSYNIIIIERIYSIERQNTFQQLTKQK